MAAALKLTRADVGRFRVRAQQLDRTRTTIANAAVLDIGVQDTGTDGALWALWNRGVEVSTFPDDELAVAWTLRGAPHVYRRADLPGVAAAVQPWSDVDAAKRIFDAAKPLKAAGIGILDALDTVAGAMRGIVTKPMAKGEVSTRLTKVLDEPYLRYCRPCQATHAYEQPFRLSALRAGLELEYGTSPPVLRPVAKLQPAKRVPKRLDVVRAYLRLLGPATPKQVAAYVDTPVKEVEQRWPADVVEVSVDGERRWCLEADGARLRDGPVDVVRLLGPFDLFLQSRDRETLVPDAAHAKALWPVLGRPGAVLADGELVGIWRPRKAGKTLTVLVEPWRQLSAGTRDALAEQAERLATSRQLASADLEIVK